MPSGGGVEIDLSGVHDLLDKLNDLEKPRKTLENSYMRGLSYNAAQQLVPVVESAVRRSPAPQSAGVAATVRAKRDRMIVVRVGAVKPKLSGFAGRGGGRAKSVWQGTVAWGVAMGPKAHGVRVMAHRRRTPGARKRNSTYYQVGSFTRAYGNPYRVGRAGAGSDPFSGYLRGAKETLVDRAGEAYRDIILEVAWRNGWPVK